MASDTPPHGHPASGNGRVLDPRPPLRPAIVRLDPLPGRASWEDLARAYASIATNDHQHKEQQYTELDEFRAAIVTLDLRVGRFRDDVRDVVTDLLVNPPGGGTLRPPPMRRREDSTHAIEELTRGAGESAKAKAEAIDKAPGVSLTPDVVKMLIEGEVKSALEQQREIDRVKKLEADAAAAEEKKKADAVEAERLRIAREADARLDASNKKNAKYLTWSGIVVGLVVLVATTLLAFAQGRTAEHDKAYAEGKAAAPVVPVPVVVSAPSAARSAP